MLFRRQNAEMRHIQNLTPLIFLALMIVFIIALSVCTAGKGSIVILENPNGTEFTMDFKDWSAKNKCELSLTRDDVLQIEIARESGEITFAVSGKSGSEPYAGNNLKSGIFTVAVSETDKYVMQISGKDATGKIVVKNSGNRVKQMVRIYLSGTGGTTHCTDGLIYLLDEQAQTVPIEKDGAVTVIQDNERIVPAYPVQFTNAPVMVRDFIKFTLTFGKIKRISALQRWGAFSGDDRHPPFPREIHMNRDSAGRR